MRDFQKLWNEKPWWKEGTTDKEMAEFYYKKGLEAKTEPVAEVPCSDLVIKDIYDLDKEELIERLENIEFAVQLFLFKPDGRNKERMADLIGRDLQGKPL